MSCSMQSPLSIKAGHEINSFAAYGLYYINLFALDFMYIYLYIPLFWSEKNLWDLWEYKNHEKLVI